MLAVLLPLGIGSYFLWPEPQTDAELLAAAAAAEQAGKPREAEIALKTLLQRTPDQPALRRRLGMLLLANERPADALSELSAGDPGETITADHLAALIEAAAGAGQHAQGLIYLERYKAQWPVSPELMLTESELLLATGQLDAAGALAEQVRAGGANTVGADLLLARVAIRRADLAEAERTLDEVLTAAPENLDALILMAGLRANRGDTEGTEQMLETVVRAAPDDPRPDLMRLEIALASHEWEDARRRLMALNERQVSGLRMTRAEALIALADGRFAEAKRALLTLTGASADDPIALLALAELQVQDGEWHLAELNLRTLLSAQPDWPPATRLLAEVLLARGDGAGAMRLLAPLIPRAGSDPGLAALIGRAGIITGNVAQGHAWLTEAAQLAPGARGRIVQLALADMAMGQEERGLTALSAAVEADPDNWENTGLLLGALLHAQETDAAIAIARARVRAYPEAPESHLLLGGLQLALGDLDPARVTFENLRALPGARPLAELNLARVELAAGRASAARARLIPLAEARSIGPVPALMLAYLERAALGNMDGAKRWLEEARRNFPDDPRPQLAYAALALDTGDAETALLAATQVLGQHPDYAEAVQLAASAERALGDPQGAWARLVASPSGVAGNPGRALLMADIAVELDDHHSAREFLAAATADGPLRLDLQMKAIRVALALDDTAMAERLLTELKELAPLIAESTEVSLLGGELALARGDRTGAAATFLATFSDYRSPEAFRRWAQLKLADGAADEVLARLDAEPELEASDITFTYLRGQAMLANGARNAAIRLFEDVRSQTPGNVENLISLSVALWDRRQPGDASKALDYAARAERLAPADPAVVAHFGRMLLDQGQSARALEVLLSAAETRPGDASLQYRLALAEVAEGYPDEASNRLRRLLRRNSAFEERAAAAALLERLE